MQRYADSGSQRGTHLAGGSICHARRLELLYKRVPRRQAALQAVHLTLHLLSLGPLDLRSGGGMGAGAHRAVRNSAL
jgi:hypothetical protein